MNDYETQIFDLRLERDNAILERDATITAYEELQQTRERHALQVISDIAQGATYGDEIPTLESLRVAFGGWVRRQKWNKTQMIALMSAEDALDDIIAGRMKPLTALEVIAMKERGEL